jgi:hypothetical protein
MSTVYLSKLENKFVKTVKLGRDNFYLNTRLFDAFHLEGDKAAASIESVG